MAMPNNVFYIVCGTGLEAVAESGLGEVLPVIRLFCGCHRSSYLIRCSNYCHNNNYYFSFHYTVYVQLFLILDVQIC
jgi:hypothetical protein